MRNKNYKPGDYVFINLGQNMIVTGLITYLTGDEIYFKDATTLLIYCLSIDAIVDMMVIR